MLVVQDLVFVVRQVPDDRFKREGDDLITQVRIRLPDALSEGKIDIPHIDDRILRVPLKEVCWGRFPCWWLFVNFRLHATSQECFRKCRKQ